MLRREDDQMGRLSDEPPWFIKWKLEFEKIIEKLGEEEEEEV